MSPRHNNKKSEHLSREATHKMTERTALLIERVEKSLTLVLTRLHKERDELIDFAYTHFGHVTSKPKSPDIYQDPTETEPTS